jgi:hypothetical protein
MLNWEDPLAKFNEPAFKPQPKQKQPHAGDGIVSNEALMNTAGAAPVVNPVPPVVETSSATAPAAVDSYDDDTEADLTGTGLE